MWGHNGNCFSMDFKRGVAWIAIALGAGLLLTVLPSAWIVLILGVGLVALGCKLMF